MINYQVEEITPELAKLYLLKNNANRNLSPHTVNCYAEDMKNNEWLLNGEPICFDEKGDLVNGQHRLNAVIKSGKTISFLVVRNVSQENSKIYDRGRARQVKDTLIMKGYAGNISNFAPQIARLYFYCEAGQHKPSDHQVKHFIDKHEKELSYVISITHNSKDLTINVAAALVRYPLLCAMNNGENAERLKEFIEVLRTGYPKNAEEDIAAITLRNDIINQKINTGGGGVQRVLAVTYIENAIYDFCRRRGRKRTYTKCEKMVYKLK